ncbi:MAG: Gfo/Idh/MocA family protein [Lacisediminihabitans sp.]
MTAVLNWGVLGTARIAEQQVIPAIGRSTNGRVLGVSSGSGRASDYAERLGIERAYPSHDELLADPDIDAVYIPLPNALHRYWTIRAAEAGKHVLCEKPIALSSVELREIEAACVANGVQFAEAFMYRHHPQIAVVRELIADGRIGELVAIEARFHFVLDAVPGENIRLSDILGGGALRDVGCYPIDLMNLLIGSAPIEVTGVAIREQGSPVETGIAAVVRYESVTGTIGSSFRSPVGDGCTIIGRAGSIELRHPFRPDKNDGTGIIVVTAADRSETIEVSGDSYRGEVEDFVRRAMVNAPDEAGSQLSRWTVQTTERIASAAGLPDASAPPASTTAPRR